MEGSNITLLILCPFYSNMWFISINRWRRCLYFVNTAVRARVKFLGQAQDLMGVHLCHGKDLAVAAWRRSLQVSFALSFP